MKNLLHLTLLSIIVIFIASCGQDGFVTELEQEVPENLLYRMDVQGDQFDIVTITTDELREYVSTTVNERSNNTSTSGIFSIGDLMGTFTAMQNNGGMHGSSHLTGDAFWIDVRINSDCIATVENTAFWGGVITKWVVGDPESVPFDVGWQFVYSAKDNGEGNGSDPDEIGEAYIIAPPDTSPSDFGLPFDTWCDFAVADYDFDWGTHGHGHFPGDDPTNIQVQ